MSVPTNPVQILTAATAPSAVPSAATDGFAIRQPCDRALFQLKNTAGSGGSLSVTVKLWGYCGAMDAWAPLGVHATAATKGMLNGGNAIAETAANVVRHAEEIFGLMRVERVYAQITAIAGTDHAVSAWLDCVPCSAITAG